MLGVNVNYISLAACLFQILVAFSAVDQIRLIHIHRTPEQISVVHNLAILISCALWSIHSVTNYDYYLLIPQIPAIVFTLVILMQKAYITRQAMQPSSPSHFGV